MAAFAWEGRTRGGEIKKGTMDAETEVDVTARLRQMGISLTKVKPKGREIALELPLWLGGGVGAKEIVIFTRQLATMIDAGLPIVQCLEILGSQSDSKQLKRILAAVKSDVEAGKNVSDALRKHPAAFDDLYVNLVAAGEAGGILDRILSRLAAYQEKAQALARQVKGALVYPAAIFVVAILVVVVLLWKVVPVFENMFKDLGGGALPAPTQFVINVSNGFQSYWYIIFGLMFGMVAGVRWMLRTPWGRKGFDTVVLKVPLFGPLLRKVAVARFTRTLGTLLSSGVPILDSLEIVARTAGNVVIANAIMYSRQRISEGKNIVEPLAETAVFPSMVVQMIGVGEQTGAMDTMLQKIADFYEEEVDVAVTSLTKLMEPIMLVFLGGIVGGLLIAMYAPIFELAGNIKAG